MHQKPIKAISQMVISGSKNQIEKSHTLEKPYERPSKLKISPSHPPSLRSSRHEK
jgi:hypothetical protein